jgi:hypothetical protein
MEKGYKFTIKEVQDILWIHLKEMSENVNDDDVLTLSYGIYPSNFMEFSENDHILLKVT